MAVLFTTLYLSEIELSFGYFKVADGIEPGRSRHKEALYPELLGLTPPPQNNFYMAFFVSSWYKDLYHRTFGAGGERGSEHDDEELADQDDERD